VGTDWRFLVIWEFRAKPEMKSAFEKSYGPEGVWARFFRSGEGFVATELIRDESGRYFTMDYWVSEEAYDKFRAQHVESYQKIDAECEAMTESEKEIGRFARIEG
jgi:heme-degrading monooxygenase HmoA